MTRTLQVPLTFIRGRAIGDSELCKEYGAFHYNPLC